LAAGWGVGVAGRGAGGCWFRQFAWYQARSVSERYAVPRTSSQFVRSGPLVA